MTFDIKSWFYYFNIAFPRPINIVVFFLKQKSKSYSKHKHFSLIFSPDSEFLYMHEHMFKSKKAEHTSHPYISILQLGEMEKQINESAGYLILLII